jgi:hypothetical protein
MTLITSKHGREPGTAATSQAPGGGSMPQTAQTGPAGHPRTPPTAAQPLAGPGNPECQIQT